MIIAHRLWFILTIHLPFSVAINPIIPINNLTSLSGEGCIPKSSIFTRVPTFTDCRAAISQLPRIDGYGSFHNGPPDDPYALPVEKTVRTCTVSIEMRHSGSSRDASSWKFIVQATLKFSRDCLHSWPAPERGAGVIVQFGSHGRILATVRYYKAVNDRKGMDTA